MLDRYVEQNANYGLNLVFSPPNEKKKKIETVPHPSRSGWKVDVFRDPWFTLRGEFLDGTRFLVTIVERYQTAYGWKRGSSGKSKYKSKSKSKGLELQIVLSYSRRKYGAIKVLQPDAEAAIHLPANVRLRDLKLTDKGMKLSAKLLPDAANPTKDLTEALDTTMTMMFLSLYQILNLARVLSKKKEA